MINSHSVADEEFTLVTSRRKKNRSKQFQIKSQVADISEVVDVKSVLKRILEAQSELESSEYYASFLSSINQIQNNLGSIKDIICFGIGHFSHCSVSRHQLAFILCIRNSLNIENITFHEPILSKSEVEILQKLQCRVFPENLEGKVSIDVSSLNFISLVYAPHCPKQLTNNFIWRNWSAAAFSRTILVANSFSNIISTTPTRFLETDAKYILRIAEHTEEKTLKNNFRYTDIFNDTSVHFWPIKKLNKSAVTFWIEDIDEPKYLEDIELISSNLISKLDV